MIALRKNIFYLRFVSNKPAVEKVTSIKYSLNLLYTAIKGISGGINI